MNNLKEMKHDIEILEKKINAKRDVLKEILTTFEDSESQKRRRNIEKVLSSNVVVDFSETSTFTLSFFQSFRFESYFCVVMSIRNKMSELELLPNAFTIPSSPLCKWTLFKNQNDPTTIPCIPRNEQAYILVAFSNSILMKSNPVTVNITCQEIPKNQKMLSASFYCLFSEKPTSLSILVKNEPSCQFDFHAIQFLEDSVAVEYCRSVMTCYWRRRLTRSMDVSFLQQRFAKFSNIDGSNWKMLVGRDEYYGIVIISLGTDKVSWIYGQDQHNLMHFVNIVNEM